MARAKVLAYEISIGSVDQRTNLDFSDSYTAVLSMACVTMTITSFAGWVVLYYLIIGVEKKV